MKVFVVNIHIEGCGLYVFKFHGILRKFCASLLSNTAHVALHSQLYMMDMIRMTSLQYNVIFKCVQTTMVVLQDILRSHCAFHGHHKQVHKRQRIPQLHKLLSICTLKITWIKGAIIFMHGTKPLHFCLKMVTNHMACGI